MEARTAEAGQADTPLRVDEHGLDGHAPRETHSLHAEIMLIAGSDAVRAASDKLMDVLYAYALVPASSPEFLEKLAGVSATINDAKQAFIEAARSEIAS